MYCSASAPASFTRYQVARRDAGHVVATTVATTVAAAAAAVTWTVVLICCVSAGCSGKILAGRRRCPAGGGSVSGGEGELGVVLGSGASGASGAAPGLCFPFTPAQYRAPHREGEGVPLGTGTWITIPALYQPGLLGAAPAAEMAFSHLGESGYTMREGTFDFWEGCKLV